jgi:hypothetical protein
LRDPCPRWQDRAHPSSDAAMSRARRPSSSRCGTRCSTGEKGALILAETAGAAGVVTAATGRAGPDGQRGCGSRLLRLRRGRAGCGRAVWRTARQRTSLSRGSQPPRDRRVIICSANSSRKRTGRVVLHGTQKPVGLIGYRNFRASGKPAGTPPPSRRSDPKYALSCPPVSNRLCW